MLKMVQLKTKFVLEIKTDSGEEKEVMQGKHEDGMCLSRKFKGEVKCVNLGLKIQQ